MKWVFWLSLAIIAYAYFGYIAWLWLRVRLRPNPTHSSPHLVPVSVVLVVHNEADAIERKLHRLLTLNYPPEQMQIVVVSDGSTDETDRILKQFSTTSRLHILLNPKSRGKSACINDAVERATGEIVVFVDARQQIEWDAVRNLLENFADPNVGCVSGELMLGCGDSDNLAGGLGMYWRFEKKIREMESATGSVIGATGALYAVRRSLLVTIPEGTILDDVYIPMHALRSGSRVVFEARARVWDIPHQGTTREFARKVRTLSGNYQLLCLAPWLLTAKNPVWFRFVSHKLLRLIVPFALVALFLSSLALVQPLYRIALAGQVAFYGLSVFSLFGPKHGLLARAADAAFALVMLNAAAVVALGNFAIGRKVVWAR